MRFSDERMEAIRQQQGWNDDTVASVLENFILYDGRRDLIEFLTTIAAEENQSTSQPETTGLCENCQASCSLDRRIGEMALCCDCAIEAAYDRTVDLRGKANPDNIRILNCPICGGSFGASNNRIVEMAYPEGLDANLRDGYLDDNFVNSEDLRFQSDGLTIRCEQGHTEAEIVAYMRAQPQEQT